MRKLAHIGKQPLKFSFEVYLCDVRGLPIDAMQVMVAWERSGKTEARSRTVSTQPSGSEERTAMVDENLRSTATLYRSARRATFDPKPSTISVLEMNTQGAPVVLGSVEVDLADHADLNAEAPARSKQLRIPRTVRRGNAESSMTIQMTISSRWLQTETLPHDDATSDGTRSEGSSALTHEALQALDASQRQGLSAPLRNQMKRSNSFGRGAKNASAQQASRVEELTKLVAEATADARQAESRLSTLQFRLRTEVVESTTEVLKKGSILKKPDEVAKLYQRHLVRAPDCACVGANGYGFVGARICMRVRARCAHAGAREEDYSREAVSHAQRLARLHAQVLLKDQVERISHDNGGSLSSGGGVSPLESEVLTLRRELASTKMEVARLAGENDELDHVARRLNKQLATLASQSPR